MELELGPLRFGIVGAGRLGCAIGRALQQRGLEVVQASSRTAEGRSRATHALEVPVHEDPLAVTDQVDCVLLCVPDDAVAGVVQRLAQRPANASPMRLRIVSCSAAGGRAVLEPLAQLGHDTCVVHPVASVADHAAGPEALAGAGAAIGAADEAGRALAQGIARALGLSPFDLDEDGWPLHAAACTLASGGTVAMLAACEQLAAHAGVHDGVARSTYARLASAAVERSVRVGPVAALAGPVPRGDARAVSQQIDAVTATSSEVDALFVPLVVALTNRAFTSGRIDMGTHQALMQAVMGAPIVRDDDGGAV